MCLPVESRSLFLSKGNLQLSHFRLCIIRLSVPDQSKLQDQGSFL